MTAFTATVPGRVNLIGEHTDYNGGMVLPAALSVSLTATLIPREDRRVGVSARGYPGSAERSLDEAAQGHWSDPAVGAVREANALGLLHGGASLSIRSTIPAGSGLSSSAALIVAILKAAREAAESDIPDLDLAVAARRVENDYIGVPCGIMDQVAVAVARPGEAIALDTATLEYSLVTLPDSHSMIVIHSGYSRKLTDGRYKARKEECDAARLAFGREAICTLDPSEIEAATGIDETIRRRARHCATEHRRVIAAREAIDRGDMAVFGALMNASHISMRDDFEMSTPPIDALVADAVELGSTGARLTGGGFGGCIVACVSSRQREEWQARLVERHPKARYIAHIGG
ncbi:galactokinase [Erythrobacter litoralis]|uniref:Galactokinase n=1 Tax=Erythrobacter litoralis (strain HTCC2594) TaxID=314225 RepID=Q2NBZ9_ERYLH|nr:galactokinase [Erythrobacter litoralis]ABC62792.1 galactokinase [Erythrobacter litoralis HTCC2594]